MNLFDNLPEAPPTKEFKAQLYTDGGSRGNPGIAGCGGVIYGQGKQELATFAEFLGHQTNNYAEYKGLIVGFAEALKLGVTHLEVFMDSKLAIEQMKGSWKVKHPQIKILFQEAKVLEEQFQNVQYAHVLRHLNTRADELGNQAMDRGF